MWKAEHARPATKRRTVEGRSVKAARLATRFLRRTPTAARCNMLHSLTTAALTPLSSFPEYISSHKHKEKGMMDHALADMQRVVDVLHSSMGPSGRLSVAASIKLASLCLTNGNIIAAEEALKLPIPLQDITGTEDMLNTCCLLQAAATCKVIAGDLSGAMERVTACDALQERCSRAGGELDETAQGYLSEIMSFSHGLKSVISLYGGDHSGAATAGWLFLDTACNEHAKLVAANNLGAIQCLSLVPSGAWAPLTAATQPAMGHLTSDAESALHEALETWDEALSPVVIDAIKSIPKDGEDEESPKHKFLQSEESAVLLSHFLSTRSEVLSALTLSERAASDASLGLRVLDGHTGEEVDGEGNTPAAVVGAVGRGVTLLAYRHLHAAEGISAEGFFRKAVACLTEGRLAADPMYKADAYAAMSGYAQLLSKWERREKHGEQLLEEADKHVADVPLFPSSGIRLSQFIQLPNVF